MTTPTTIGTWASDRGYTAVSVQQHDEALLVVCEHHDHPDDPHPVAVVTARYALHEQRLAEAAAATGVLARGGRLQGTEPEQLAESPVRGQALRALRRDAPPAPLELPGRDGRPVGPAQAKRMFAAELGRYVHVGTPDRRR
ncbi:MAG TPA: hypothetical protein VGV36_03335 [Solirubrobacteraceae bacterium]|nr:hypothetical protein [Solirubrobacteraceae bacterium]